MNDRIFFRPVIPLLISLMGGILLGSQVAGFAVISGLLVAVCGGFGLMSLLRRKAAVFMPMLLFASLGYLSIQPWLSPRIPTNHVLNYTDTHRWDIRGQIDTQPLQIKNRTRFDMRVASLHDAQQTHKVTGLLRVTARGAAADMAVGDIIGFKSRMRSVTNFNNPGGFDYQRYMAFSGVYATAYVRADRIRIVQKSPPTVFSATINRVRGQFADLVEQSGSPEARGVLKALIIGDRTQISDTTRYSFNRAGVAHLLAISGLHIGIVASVAFAFSNWLMGWIKPLLWRAWTRKSAALLSLLPVIGYGVVAGLSPSTQRAVLMVSVFLMTFLMAREQDSLNTLALAALVILIADPPALFSISFQLSFATVFVIIYGFSSFKNFGFLQNAPDQSNWPRRFSVKLITFFLVSLFAIGGSLPLVAFYFNQISLVGLAANFLVVPLVGFVSIPFGLAALFISPLSTALASLCLKAGAASLAVALDIVRFFAALPFAAVHTVTPSVLEIICYYILGWALLNRLRVQPDGGPTRPATDAARPNPDGGSSDGTTHLKRWNLKNIFRLATGAGGRGLRSKSLTRFVMGLTLLVLVTDVCYWMYQRFWHPDLRVTIIDVADGSAALLELPGGNTIMIDGGGFSDNASFDVGARIIAPLLWQKKIKTLDLLILSHPNSDHLNGLIYLADNFNVKTLWTNDEPRNTMGYKNLMAVCARRGIFLPAYQSLAREHIISGVRLDLLHPPLDFMDRKVSDKWRHANNNSLVVKVSFSDTSFLFTGDITAAAESELISLAGDHLTSSVLIAPHHGSRSSSSQPFLEEVDPEVIVISCGHRSRFGFPHPEVLKRYNDLGASIWRTDLDGAVLFSSNGQQLKIRPFLDNKPD